MTLKMSGFTPVDLIREIKIRPGIYNKAALEAPRKEHRQQLFLEVAECLTPQEEWERCTADQKEERVNEINNKWKNLRDHFYREVKLLEAGETNKKRKYIYYDEMEFVRPYIGYKQPPKKRRNKSLDSVNATKVSHYDDSDIDMEEFLKSKNKKESITVEKKLRPKSMPAARNIPKNKQNKHSSTTPLVTRSQKETVIQNFDVLQKTDVPKNPTFKIREGDISFCLSLVPTLRQMPDIRKLSAKIDILKILQEHLAQVEQSDKESIGPHDRPTDSKQDFDDLIEECEGDNIRADPLNGNSNNNKTWW